MPCTLADVPTSPENTPRLEEAVLERPGCRLVYRKREATSDRWVVFLHGAGMDGHMFDTQISSIPIDIGIAVWDARGHGRSRLTRAFRYRDMLDDLHALVQHIAPKRLTLVGQSMGGNLAQSYVELHPGAVHRLMLIDCTDNHGSLTRMERWALRMARPLLSAYPWKLTVRQSARACGVDPATIAYASRCLERMGKSTFVEVMGFWVVCLRPDPSYRFPCRTVALLGQQDKTGNVAKALARLADKDPLVELTTIPDASHNSNMDQPVITNAVLGRLLVS